MPVNLKKLYQRNGGKCYYCGRRTILICGLKVHGWRGKRVDVATRDHIIPASMGGSSGPENVVLACMGCNSAKENMTLNDITAAGWKFGTPIFVPISRIFARYSHKTQRRIYKFCGQRSYSMLRFVLESHVDILA